MTKKLTRISFFFLAVITIPAIVNGQPFMSEESEAHSPKIEKGLTAGCPSSTTATEIALNNVRALIQTGGDMWWDFKNAQYEIPKGSGKTALWNGGIWVGGTDVNGQLKLCAVRYRSGGVDFFTGPLITSGNSRGTTDIEVCYQYDKHWEITRYQVEEFREWYHASPERRELLYRGYTVPKVMLDWPAHADASAGYDFYLAPFYDQNDDGFYNPSDGDYPFYDLDGILPCGTSREHRRPRLFGDGTLWWVYNDRGNIHQESGGEPIGMEIRAQAFEFSTNDALNDMSFYNYALINRSTYTLIDTYFGVYVDGALGWAWDDFTGCHVSKGVGYFYNGETVDGSGEAWAYGANPPAIGIDFFEGPYQDPNGLDDCKSYDSERNLICNECILNGNINGLNFGDGIVDNERWGMRRFVYYVNSGGVTGDPQTAPEYYNFLRGFWKDNERMRYGGNAHPAGGGAGPITDFMFPGDSDPCGWGQGGIPQPVWTEETAGNEPYDRRMVQSSGPFVLEPGAVNDITTGVVYARSYDGTPWASVRSMLQEDEKAQRLFENCFKVVNGPDAPEITIVEQDQKLIFHVWNKPSSNNYLEQYVERDPFIVCPLDQPDCDVNYVFQGYQVWQLKNDEVSITDATSHNSNLARIIFQCDKRDGIDRIVNYDWNTELEANEPVVEVDGANQGISHTFVVDEDLFATGVRNLVNFKTYYYTAVAYAYNSYKVYSQNDPDSFDGQKKPYLAGRRGAGGPIKSYAVIPHPVEPEEGGTIIQGEFGDAPKVYRIEGHGTGRNVVDIDSVTHDKIMDLDWINYKWENDTYPRLDKLGYVEGKSPIDISVVDPLNVAPDTYTLKFDSVNYFQGSTMNGKVLEGKWFITNSKMDTIWAESWIENNYDQLLLEWGLSINVTQEEIPYRYGSVNNGFLEATMEFENPSEPWVWFVPDDDRAGPRNWIRAGYAGGDYGGDRDAIYEKVLGGTWAPFAQCYIGTNGVADSDARAAIDTKRSRLANVDLYLTPDRSKWTRSPVVETGDDEALSINNIEKFMVRDAPSIDKFGNPAEIGLGVDSFNEEAANYLSETGLGWFPGYAIDVETGERLNIVYGESSFLTGDNGADMLWNPSTREGSKLYEAQRRLTHEGVYFGGKHFIYVMGHNNVKSRRDNYYYPPYDGGQWFLEKMADRRNRYKVRELFVNAMWTSIPILDERYVDEAALEEDPYAFVKNELKLRFRVVGQYAVDVLDLAVEDSLSQNHNMPMYEFETTDIATLRGDKETAVNALETIRVVPNPYYGYNAYENSQFDNRVKIINLPKTCTISIYALNGNMVRRMTKDADQTYLDWNIKNQYGIPVSSGVYIIHIDAPGIGQKVLKWFGVLRPQDLHSL